MAKSKWAILDSTPGPGAFVFQDAKARLKLQALVRYLQDLQKGVDATRRNLVAAKKKKLMVAAEVRFLRRRHQYLLKEGSTSLSQARNFVQDGTERAVSSMKRPPPAANLHRTEGTKTASRRKRAPLFDLNEISGGDEDIQCTTDGAEPVKMIMEEANTSMVMTSSSYTHCENILQNDMKLLLCRNAGEGSSRAAAKRKISWQDPVAVGV